MKTFNLRNVASLVNKFFLLMMLVLIIGSFAIESQIDFNSPTSLIDDFVIE